MPFTLNVKYSDIIIIILFISSPLVALNVAFRNIFYKLSAQIFAVFIFFLLFMGIYSNDVVRHLSGVVQYAFCFFILIPVLLSHSKGDMNKILMPFIFGAMFSLCLLVVSYVSGTKLFSEIITYGLTGGGVNRYSIGATNDYGFILAVTIIFIHLVFRHLSKILKLVFSLFFVVALVGLIVTASRSSFILLAAYFFIVVMVTMLKNKRVRIKALGSFVVISVLSVAVLPSVGEFIFIDNLKRMTSISLDLNEMAGDRFEQYHIGAEMVNENAMAIGRGINSYQDLSLSTHPIHNVFIIMAVEAGILPGFLFFFFWMSILIVSVRSWTIGITSFAIIASVLLYIQTITHIYDRFFWIPIAISFLLFTANNNVRFSKKILCFKNIRCDNSIVKLNKKSIL